MANTVDYVEAKILIVDDQPNNIELLERILHRAGYTRICAVTHPPSAVLQFLEFQPDIVLLDLHMPVIDGRELLQLLSPLIPEGTFLPMLVLTADISQKTKREALLLGANDFLTKPLDRVEVLLRIRNHLQTRFLNLEVQANNRSLKEKVNIRTQELNAALIATIECLAKASEYRDDNTGEHTRRVGEISASIASAMGFDEERVRMIALAASLHDIGKIGIPDEILLKPTTLTNEEFDIMKTHTTIGEHIISNTNFSILQLTKSIALTHHERWDGEGYPNGLAGDEIPIEGQIVSIADVYDALTHARPYKPSWPVKRAVLEIEMQSGKQFNPIVVSAFLSVIEDIKLI